MKPIDHTGTLKILLELLEVPGKGITPNVEENEDTEPIPIGISNIIDPLTFFNRFETFIQGLSKSYEGVSGEKAIAGTDMSSSVFYDRKKKWASTVEHFRRSYWQAVSQLPFSCESDRYPLLLYVLKPRPELKTVHDQNLPLEFAGLCRSCLYQNRDWVFPFQERTWYCVYCGRLMKFASHPLEFGRRRSFVENSCITKGQVREKSGIENPT